MNGGVAAQKMTVGRLTLAATAAAVAMIAAAGCGSEQKAEPPATGAASPTPPPTAANSQAQDAGAATGKAAAEQEAGRAVAAAGDGRATAPAPASAAAARSPIPSSARQLILGVVSDWDAVPAQLSRWERSAERGAWRAVGEPWAGVVGSGAAWGRGLHGEGPPTGQSGPQKVEGDGRSPAGVFALGGAYGYAGKPPAEVRWPYTPVDGSWHCVDDSASKTYGTIVDADAVTKDWASSEKMRRRDALYTWVVDVAHNPAHTPKAGSCIFLHVWRAAGEPTVGCTAMPEPRMREVLAWMSPDAQPVYVLLPRSAYAALAGPWGLPALAP